MNSKMRTKYTSDTHICSCPGLFDTMGDFSQATLVGPLGETTTPAPEECRSYPGRHADLASFGGETGKDMVDVGSCKLSGKEGEGVCDCCLLFLKERASL